MRNLAAISHHLHRLVSSIGPYSLLAATVDSLSLIFTRQVL